MNPSSNRLRVILAVVFGTAFGASAPAQVYLAYTNVGLIAEYNADSGALVKETLVLGLKQPGDLCLKDNLLYVVERGSGHIGTYDMNTGAPIHPELVSGLNMPQAMTVAGDAIYVSDFNWQTGQPRIGKYNAFTGAEIDSTLITLTGDVINGMTITPMSPSALAVSGNRLFVATQGGLSGLKVFDTGTGALITGSFAPYLTSVMGLDLAGPWLYLALGRGESGGAIFKFDPVTRKSPFDLPGSFLPRPMVGKLNDPGKLAVSGDSLFVSEGGGTAIGKYNATTGAVIAANFIPSAGDHLGGLAVVPRAPTEEETAGDSQFAWEWALLDDGVAFMENANYFVFGACGLVTFIALGMLAFAFRPRTPAPLPVVDDAQLPTEGTLEAPHAGAPTEATPALTEASPLPDTVTPVIPEESGSPRLTRMAIGLLILVALIVAGYTEFAPTRYGGAFDPDPDRDLIGAWQFDNDGTRQPEEMPIIRILRVFPNQAEYSEGSGSNTKPGTWHDDGFWIKNADGSGEIEVARLVDPLDLEVHVSAFMPDRSDVVTLYKVVGNAAETQAIAAKYPPPLTYPPPKGVITYDMTEYDLTSLPWKPQYLSPVGEVYSRGTLYHFQSDNPAIPPLEVTVKNRHVVEIKGGYP